MFTVEVYANPKKNAQYCAWAGWQNINVITELSLYADTYLYMHDLRTNGCTVSTSLGDNGETLIVHKTRSKLHRVNNTLGFTTLKYPSTSYPRR